MNPSQDYDEFLASKAFTDIAAGHDVPLEAISSELFEFQRVLTRWALRRGRAAIFADTGLGKTMMQHVCVNSLRGGPSGG